MKKYNVRVYLSTFFDIEVEAENEEYAREIAEDPDNWNMGEIEDNLNVQPCETEAEPATRKVSVQWDTDGENVPELPTEVDVPVSVDEDNIADWLSDEYGFCVSSFRIVEDETAEEDETKDEEPQPLFSDEAIEGLHVGGNSLAIGFMHVENEADLVKAKEYLRELNRRHLAGEPLREPTKQEALAKLADVVRKYGEDEGGGITILHTFGACSDGGAELDESTIDDIRLFSDGTIRIYYNINEDDYLPADNDQFKADDMSKFADDLNRYFENEEEKD